MSHDMPETPVSISPSPSPSRRAWQRFRQHRLGYWSLIVFSAMVLLSLCAELVSNDKPLIARYEGRWYVPIVENVPETVFGGDFDSPTDYLDPFIQRQFLRREGRRAHGPLKSA